MIAKLKSLGFTSGHMHLLLVAVAFFAVLIVTKSGINYRTMFASADSEEAPITYEQIRDQVMAEQPMSTSSELTDAEAEKQFALLDRSIENGQVLGESIGLGNIPDGDQIFKTSDLNKIEVKTTSTNSDSVNAYAGQVLTIESKLDFISILSSINSGDVETLKQGKEQALALVQSMGNITVPDELVDYHRYKMIYAISLSNIAEVWLKERPESDLQVQTQIMLSAMNKIENLRQGINQRYSVSL